MKTKFRSISEIKMGDKIKTSMSLRSGNKGSFEYEVVAIDERYIFVSDGSAEHISIFKPYLLDRKIYTF